MVVPGALLYTREMKHAISKTFRTHRQVEIDGRLRDEITHWLFLEEWDNPLPWRDERHFQVSLASDASGSGWGGTGPPPIIGDCKFHRTPGIEFNKSLVARVATSVT